MKERSRCGLGISVVAAALMAAACTDDPGRGQAVDSGIQAEAGAVATSTSSPPSRDADGNTTSEPSPEDEALPYDEDASTPEAPTESGVGPSTAADEPTVDEEAVEPAPGLLVPSEATPDQPDGPEGLQEDEQPEQNEPKEDEQPEQNEPEQDEQPEQNEPTPGPEVVVRGSPAPAWPFRGLVEVDFSWDDDSGSGIHTIRYLSSRDRTVTETVIEGLEPTGCWRANIDRVSEAGVVLGALGPSDGPGGYVTLIIPWGETPTVVEPIPYTEGDSSWQDLLTSAYDHAHGYVIGGTAFDVSIHANGLRLLADEAAESYQYETWGSRYPEGEDSPPPESIQLYGDILSTLDYPYFLGTDGEFVGFATVPYEPACATLTGYLISVRTGEAFACGFAASGVRLVQSPQEGLLVEEVALPSNRQLREGCGQGILAERWTSLPPAPEPHPPKPGPEEPPLPTATAPPWPFRGAVLALQRYLPHLFSYETVLQYRSSEDGSVTELVFGPMRRRSLDLVIEADEHGIELWRRDWAVRVPWGGAAVRADIGPAAVRPARTTDYPKLITFGQRQTRMEVESFVAQERVSRLSVGHQQSWHVWSAPDESMFNTPLDLSSRRSGWPGWPLWLRGTDGRVAAISHGVSSEDCAYYCDPVLTVLISLETGQVLNCGVELDGPDALVFVAPAGSSMTPNVKLPPSGWLDPDGCYDQRIDDTSDCSWLRHYSPRVIGCGRLFKLVALPDSAAASVVPAGIQADPKRQSLLIQPAAGG